jgi:hypothetical protein
MMNWASWIERPIVESFLPSSRALGFTLAFVPPPAQMRKKVMTSPVQKLGSGAQNDQGATHQLAQAV